MLHRCLPAAALLTTAALAGCAGGDDETFGGAWKDKPNATDAAFARAMVPHQRATGEIARIGSRKALREELRALAKETVARNGPELQRLTPLAAELRRRRVSPLGSGISEPPPADPRALRAAVSIDHEFLRRMIQQHQYAIAASAAERARGGDSRLKVLAAAIHESSVRDLQKLKRWLRTWYGGDTQPPPAPPPGGGGGNSPGPEV